MFISEAFAQAAATPGTGDALMSQLFLIVPLIAIFYFLIIRPQNKRLKDHRDMVSNVRRGDTVVTSGGIIGKVVKVDDAELQVEIADNVRVRVVKSTLTEVRTKGEPAPAAASKTITKTEEKTGTDDKDAS